jgi:hypothetical protein
MQNRTRGKPLRAQNRNSAIHYGSVGEEHNVPRSTGDKELPTDKYISTDSDSDDDEFNDMDAED